MKRILAPSFQRLMPLLLAFLCPAAQAAEQILITEFMASNKTTLADNFGDYPDWIELYNSGSTPFNLQGYSLTDSATLLTQWTFPSTNIPPHRYLVVFASGNNRSLAGQPLHTNFKLSAGGGSLLLVRPDGTTVAWQIDYGPQSPDVSTGLVMSETGSSNPLPTGADARVLVPTKSLSGWFGAAFNDSTWQPSTIAIGFDTNTADTTLSSLIRTDLKALMYGATNRPDAFLRIPFTVSSLGEISDVQLWMRYNDGYAAYLNGVEIGRRNSPVTLVYNSLATAIHPRDQAVVPELLINSKLLTLLQPGTNILAIQGMNRTSTNGDFLILPEVRLRTLQAQAGDYVMLASPTPGSANPGAVTDLLPPVTLSQPGGSYAAPFTVTLSADGAPAGSVIHYTLDRSIPTESSPIYSSPLSITNSVQVRARTYAPGYHESPLVGEIYVILAAAVRSVTSDLPLIVIHTMGGGGIQASPDTLATFQIHDTVLGRSSLTNTPSVVSRITVHLHGSSTLTNPKQNLAVSTLDEDGVSKNISALGIPPDSDFILYAPDQFEPVLIHNAFMYQLSRDIGDYAVRTRFVEVYLNQSGGQLTAANYNGIYILMEKIKRGPLRVNVDALLPSDLTEPNITGGYMLKIDRTGPGEAGFNAAGIGMVYNDPSEATILQRPQQVAYITKYFNDFYAALNSAQYADPTNGYAAYIDTDTWIDHFVLDIVSFNVDGLRLSTYFYKPRNGKITFGPIWDYDRTLGSTDGRDFNPRTWRSNVPDLGTDFFNYPWWGRLFTDPNFFQKFIDRYQSLREQQLSQLAINGLIDRLTGEIHEAVPRELVRWAGFNSPRSGVATGDGGYSFNFGTQGYAGEVAFMKTWLKDRMNFMDTNFVDRPSFSVTGGTVAAGTTVALAGPPGSTLYYTLDGTDPRASGGGLSPQALAYASPIPIGKNSRLVARCRDLNHRNLTGANNPPISSPWSGPRAETYVITTPQLVITELMFHSPTTSNDTIYPAHQFDYIEFKNNGASPLALQGFSLVPETINSDGHVSTSGPSFTFPSVTLGAGQYIVVVQNLAAFRSRYGNGPLVAGQFDGAFVHGGSKLTLLGPLQEPIMVLNYKDSWDEITDGYGFSLVIKDEATAPDKWTKKSSWHSGDTYLGTPGRAEGPSISVPNVYINELIPMADGSHPVSIELYNSNSKSADVSGWWLTDSAKTPYRSRLPNGSVIPGKGYLALSWSSLGVGPQSAVTLNPSGGTLYLLSADAQGLLTGYLDVAIYGGSETGLSLGRYLPNAALLSHQVDYPAQKAPTPGVANSGPVIGPVVLSEVMYHPADIAANGAWWDNTLDEYIELYNAGDQPAPLYDAAQFGIPWKLEIPGSTQFLPFYFPGNLSLAPHGYLLVVSFDPQANPAQLDLLRARYTIPATVPVVGPYLGSLPNAGDDLLIERPAARAPESTVAPAYVIVDHLQFGPAAPWPTGAGGAGLSLQRISASGYGDDPANWVAALPTAGGANRGGASPVIVTQPQGATNIVGASQTFTVSASGTGGMGYQWMLNGSPLDGQTNATLTFPALALTDSGDYSAIVFDQNASVESAAATLLVRQPATILVPPDNLSAPYGGLAAFGVIAAGTGPLAYQWQKNGVDIPGATQPTLYLSGLDFSSIGNYRVRVTDDYRAVTSPQGFLNVLLKPTLLLQPQNTIGVQGGSASFSFSAMGTAPLAYRWKKGSTAVTSYVTSSIPMLSGITLTLPNLQSTNEGSYSVQFLNPVSTAVVSASATLKVLLDSDKDGMPDDWETANGLNPNDPSDATLDADGDGMTNRDEYIAGTDPRDRLSYLKVDQLGIGSDGRSALTFFARSNHSYSLQLKEVPLATDWNTFTNLSVRATNRLETVIDPYPTGATRVYRLLTPAQPRTSVGPVVLSNPASLSLPSGATATFRVLASGFGPVSYQWQKDGADLPGETDAALHVTSISAASAGSYQVRVIDQTGVTLSQRAVLDVR